MDNVEQYYDQLADEQVQSGINRRNLSIQALLEKHGLQEGHRVLEVGCGVGTQTELLARYVSNGSVLAVDISPKSIAYAQARLASFPQVSFEVGDITKLSIHDNFDVIVLPDSLEHIPVDQHPGLFRKLNNVLKDSGFVAIHIPNPYYLEWVRQQHPEQLQVIDQSLYTDGLCRAIYANGFYINFLKTYSIWNEPADYQFMLLRKTVSQEKFTVVEPNINLKDKLRYKLKQLLKLS